MVKKEIRKILIDFLPLLPLYILIIINQMTRYIKNRISVGPADKNSMFIVVYKPVHNGQES